MTGRFTVLTRVLLAVCCHLAVAACATARGPQESSPAPLPLTADTLPCAGEAGASACHERALLAEMERRGVEAAMQALEELAARDAEVRRFGHVYAHAIGLAAYRPEAEVGAVFARCTPAFQSGCYHGVIQAYFAAIADPASPEGGIDEAAVDALCAAHRGQTGDRWLLFQCAHGMGHGLTMVLGNDLHRALHGCDLVADAWEREACYGGVFMENVVQATTPHHSIGRPQVTEEHGHAHAHHGDATAAAAPALRADDPLYPCTSLEGRYLPSCYQMQTSAVLFFNGGDMAGAIRVCDGAPEEFRHYCYQSVGRDLSAYTVQNHAVAARTCALGDARLQPWCHVGYTKNVIDVTSRPADGLGYCRVVADRAGKMACYRAVGEHTWVLEPDAVRRAELCRQAEPGYREVCRRAARLSTERPTAG